MPSATFSTLSRMTIEGVRFLIGRVDYAAGEGRLSSERRCVRILLGALLGTGGELPYAHRTDGSPFLPAYPDLHVSVSHTEGWALVAVSDRAVGVDIERWGEQAERVARRFLHPEEENWARSSPEARTALHLLWSGKEAAYKLVRPSVPSLLLFFNKQPITIAETGRFLLHLRGDDDAARGVEIHYQLCPEYVYTVALAAR